MLVVCHVLGQNWSLPSRAHPLLDSDLSLLGAEHRAALRGAFGFRGRALPDRLQLSHAALELLARSGTTTAIMVVVDDLPWLDQASGMVLAFIARRTAGTRLGFLANFLSRTVRVGFLTGVGIQVAAGQLPGMFGVTATGKNTLTKLWDMVRVLPHARRSDLVVSVGVIVIVLAARRITRRIPGPLIAVITAISMSRAVDLAGRGVAVVGAVPRGLPHLGLPALSLHDAAALLGAAASMFVVILAQSAATSRAYAGKYEEVSFSEDTDLVGLGAANVAAAFSGTFVVNGSPTKTQMADSAGGRSQLVQLTTAVVVLIVLLLLTGPLAYLPDAALAGAWPGRLPGAHLAGGAWPGRGGAARWFDVPACQLTHTANAFERDGRIVVDGIRTNRFLADMAADPPRSKNLTNARLVWRTGLGAVDSLIPEEQRMHVDQGMAVPVVTARVRDLHEVGHVRGELRQHWRVDRVGFRQPTCSSDKIPNLARVKYREWQPSALNLRSVA